MEATAYSGSTGNAGGFVKLVLIVAVFIALAAFTALAVGDGLGAAVDTTPASQEELDFGAWLISSAPPVELTGDHADRKHPEAALVRQTCKERGVYRIYRELSDKSTFHLLCMTEGGKLVDWIIRVVNGKFVEKTAFMPRAGVMAEVIRYASSKGTRFTMGWK